MPSQVNTMPKKTKPPIMPPKIGAQPPMPPFGSPKGKVPPIGKKPTGKVPPVPPVLKPGKPGAKPFIPFKKAK